MTRVARTMASAQSPLRGVGICCRDWGSYSRKMAEARGVNDSVVKVGVLGRNNQQCLMVT